MKKIADIIKENPFFQDLSSNDIEFIASCAKNVAFKEKEIIASPGDAADEFYLIRQGQIRLSIETPPHKPFMLQTLGTNEIVGLAWLIPPYVWTISAQAIEATRAIAFDGACLREKCEQEPRLGFKLMKHLVQVLVVREDAARLHLLDIYGHK